MFPYTEARFLSRTIKCIFISRWFFHAWSGIFLPLRFPYRTLRNYPSTFRNFKTVLFVLYRTGSNIIVLQLRCLQELISFCIKVVRWKLSGKQSWLEDFFIINGPELNASRICVPLLSKGLINESVLSNQWIKAKWVCHMWHTHKFL